MKKLSFQKIFCFISFIFISSCCIYYGTRFIKLYSKNKEIEIKEENTLVKVIKENNSESETFKEINKINYFINDSKNNYLLYSNILWRIIKINNDNSITAISDNSLTSLAYGKNKTYEESYINKWLNLSNEDYSGILEKHLNKKETYLQKTTTCLDTIDELDNKECTDTNNDNYLSLLSTTDFVNIGNKESYVINNEYFYLNNTNKDNEIWFVDTEGKVTTNNGTDIIGIRPVITIKSNIDYQKGNGTKDNPYTIEKENGLFGSYVKLDNNIWRIYQVNDTEVRLILDNYLEIDNEPLEYIYSNINSYHNDQKQGSIAYYLNNNFLNTLSYKDKIKEVSWTNGYYSNTDYDYTKSLDTTIETKVALISIGDIRLNNELTNYFTLTGNINRGSSVYTIQSNQKLYTKNIQTKVNVVPTISIDKDLLTKGNGTIDSPYEME